MQITIDYKNVILDAVAHSYINLNKFDKKTGIALSRALYKALKVTSADMNETLNQTAIDALAHAIGIIGKDRGFTSGTYVGGYWGFDYSGNSTRAHAAVFNENGGAEWDAGRALALDHGFDINDWIW
jgi:hypothetical protein